MTRPSPKIVIVGGSVVGLTLANLLERLGIDYVVLEAYDEIAPQVGASLALWPNGLRILDQLGCYEKFKEGVSEMRNGNIRLEGEHLMTTKGFGVEYTKRHGHGVFFNDRQKLLQILYDNLKDKSKVLTKKRAIKVELTKTGVRVHTKDGDSFSGDMLIGGDGIHSTIRTEMWRLGHEISPGYFSKDEAKRVPINYRVMFGVTKGPPTLRPTKADPDWISGWAYMSWNQGWSYLLAEGPAGKRVYWFLFEKLKGALTYETTPRYGKEDEAEMLERHRGDVLGEAATLGELYENSCGRTGITAIHEWVFERWHFQRILTLGDAAHKPNPLTGQGANSAMEDVAALINILTRKLDAGDSDSDAPLSGEDIDGIFAELQATREERARLAINTSVRAQKMQAMDFPGAPLFMRILPHITPMDATLEVQAGLLTGSVKVDKLPLKAQPHFVPYLDELPAPPLAHSQLPRLAAAAGFGGLYLLLKRVMPSPMFDTSWPFPNGDPIKTVYTGNARLDGICTILVRAFSLVVASDDVAKPVQCAYLISMLLPTVVIWTVESRRRGNRQTLPGRLLTTHAVWAGLYQLISIAKAGPLYYVVSILANSSPLYHRTSGRPVPTNTAKALLPAVIGAFVVPSIVMFLPFRSGSSVAWQNAIAAWQIAPLLVGPATTLLASAIGASEDAEARERTAAETVHNRDVPWLLSSYVFAGGVAAVAHLAAIGFVARTPGLSFARVFGQVTASAATELGPAEAFFRLFKKDLLGLAASSLGWCLYSVYEMRRNGYVTTAKAWRAAAGVLGSLVALGPGAMYAGTWYWRESTIASLCTP